MDGELVLERIAQDFHAAFGLGDNNVTITTSDISGINMLAIQALETRPADLELLPEELEAARGAARTPTDYCRPYVSR